MPSEDRIVWKSWEVFNIHKLVFAFALYLLNKVKETTDLGISLFILSFVFADTFEMKKCWMCKKKKKPSLTG